MCKSSILGQTYRENFCNAGKPTIYCSIIIYIFFVYHWSFGKQSKPCIRLLWISDISLAVRIHVLIYNPFTIQYISSYTLQVSGRSDSINWRNTYNEDNRLETKYVISLAAILWLRCNVSHLLCNSASFFSLALSIKIPLIIYCCV